MYFINIQVILDNGFKILHKMAKNTEPEWIILFAPKSIRTKKGIPMLVNTSFNVKGESIVCNLDDAINCVLSIEIDAVESMNLLTTVHKCQIQRQALGGVNNAVSSYTR